MLLLFLFLFFKFFTLFLRDNFSRHTWHYLAEQLKNTDRPWPRHTHFPSTLHVELAVLPTLTLSLLCSLCCAPEMTRRAPCLVFVPGEDDSSPNDPRREAGRVNEAAPGALVAPAPMFWSPPTFRLVQAWSPRGAASSMPSNSPAAAELPQTPDDDMANDVVKKL